MALTISPQRECHIEIVLNGPVVAGHRHGRVSKARGQFGRDKHHLLCMAGGFWCVCSALCTLMCSSGLFCPPCCSPHAWRPSKRSHTRSSSLRPGLAASPSAARRPALRCRRATTDRCGGTCATPRRHTSRLPTCAPHEVQPEPSHGGIARSR